MVVGASQELFIRHWFLPPGSAPTARTAVTQSLFAKHNLQHAPVSLTLLTFWMSSPGQSIPCVVSHCPGGGGGAGGRPSFSQPAFGPTIAIFLILAMSNGNVLFGLRSKTAPSDAVWRASSLCSTLFSCTCLEGSGRAPSKRPAANFCVSTAEHARSTQAESISPEAARNQTHNETGERARRGDIETLLSNSSHHS